MIELIAIYCTGPDACERIRLASYDEDQACIEQLINLSSETMRAYFQGEHISFECTRQLEDLP